MALPDELKFIGRLLEPIHLSPSPMAMARICGWTIIFLILIHFLIPRVEPQLPYSKEMAAQNLIPISSATSDPKWSRQDLYPLPDNSVIWIGDSSIAMHTDTEGVYSFLPGHVNTPYRSYVSVKMARRMLDTYSMVLDAMARKPAGMVVVINPFWDFMDTAPFFKTNLMNRGASLWANSTDWLLIALLSSPGNVLWSLAGRHHYGISQGYDILKTLKPDGKPANNNKNKKEKFSYNQPAMFWMVTSDDNDLDPRNLDAASWQIEIMRQNNIEQSQWSLRILRQMFEKITASGIPALVYLAPVAPGIERSPAREAYQTIQGQMGQMEQEFENEKLSIVPFIPQAVQNSLGFVDMLHIRDAGYFPDYLGQEIYGIMEAP